MVFKDAISIIKEIKSGQINPVYFLHGEEGYHIDKLSNYIEASLLSDGEKAFNQQVLYGKDVGIQQILDYARQFPMMGQYRVLIIKEAQEINLKSESDKQVFEAYLKNPSTTSVLVFGHKTKKADGRANWFKIIKDKYVVLESNAIKDYAVRSWVQKYLSEKGFKIDIPAAELVSEYLGTDLAKVSNELDKLIVNLKDTTSIGLKEVENNIGISKDYNVFELQDALITKNYKKSQRIVANFQGNMKRHPMEMIVGSLFSFYQRLFIVHQNIRQNDAFLSKAAGVNPYFLSKSKEQARGISTKGFYNAFKIINDYDGRMKGFNNRSVSREELLKELVGKLLLIR